MDERLLREFLAEAEDLTEGLYADVAELRLLRGDGPARRELVARIFRRAHSLKGTAAAAGLEAAGGVAHEFESLLDAVREGRAPLDDEALDAFEEAVGAVAASLEGAARGGQGTPPEGLLARLRRLAARAEGAGEAAAFGGDDETLPELPLEVERALSAHERRRLSEALGEGARAYVVSAEFDLADFDEKYKSLVESLKESGEVVATQPFVNAVGPERVGFRIVYASTQARALLEGRAARFGATLSAAGGAGEPDDGGAETQDATARPTPSAPPTPGAHAAGVRLTLEELEDLISTTHSLFADTVAALDAAHAGGAEGEARAASEERARGVRRRFFELEERLIGLRMVSLRGALLRAARAGRAAAREAGKRVEFEVAGGDARLDRALAERVADPLLHLVRNAVDHGVEPESERLARGKAAAGRVRLEAESEAGLVLLRVSDDGRGVEPEAVARAAEAAGLVAPGANVTEAQALRLIFRPGFSTSARATLVSGRGVGLDVVERAVEEAGGEVHVRSERGRGATFELRLPTTLALVAARMVNAGGRRYCLAAEQLVESGRARADEVVGEGAGRRLLWGGRELPLVELRELLGVAAAPGSRPEDDGVTFVVARGRQAEGGGAAEARAAVRVDALGGEGEVLVRGLGRHAKRWRGVSGAAELSDGAVALVLDLPRLLEGLD